MRKFILIAVLLLVGVTYGQNYTYPVGLYSYESLSTLNAYEKNVVDEILEEVKVVKPIIANQNEQNYMYPVGLYNYNSFSMVKKMNRDEEFVKKAKTKEQLLAEDLKKQNEKSRSNIVIRKAKTEVLVRYNGKYSSIKLVNLKGDEVEADFSKKYRGLIVPRAKEEQNYFLEVVKNNSKTYYHQVSL